MAINKSNKNKTKDSVFSKIKNVFKREKKAINIDNTIQDQKINVQDQTIKKGGLTKIIIPMVLGIIAVAILLAVGINNFTYRFSIDEDGYVISKNTDIDSMVPERRDSSSLYKINIGDNVYYNNENDKDYYIGDEKQSISSGYAAFTRNGQVLYFLSDNATLIDEYWDTIPTYEGLRLSDGVTFNSDDSRADAQDILLISVENKHQLAQEIKISNQITSTAIPMNTICSFTASRIDCYEYNKGTLESYSLSAYEDSVIEIGDKTYSYKDFLEKLGIVKRQSTNPVIEKEETEIENEEQENVTVTQKEKTSTPKQPKPASPAEAASEDVYDAQGNRYEKPVVKVSSDVSSWVYTYDIPVEVYDPTSRILGGIQFYAYEVTTDPATQEEKRASSAFLRVAYLGNDGTFVFGEVKPDTTYELTYSYKYKDQSENKIQVNEVTIGRYKTLSFDTLNEIELDFNNESALYYGNKFEISDLYFGYIEDEEFTTPINTNSAEYNEKVLKKSYQEKRAETYINRIRIEYVKADIDYEDGTYEFTDVDDIKSQYISTSSIEILKKGFHLDKATIGLNKLDSKSKYTYRIVLLDKFDNEFTYTGSAKELNFTTNQFTTNSSYSLHKTRTSAKSPQVSIIAPDKVKDPNYIRLDIRFYNEDNAYVKNDNEDDTKFFIVYNGKEQTLDNAVSFSAVKLDADGKETTTVYENVKYVPIDTEIVGNANNVLSSYKITGLDSNKSYTAIVMCAEYEIDDNQTHTDEILKETANFATASLSVYGKIRYSGYADNISDKSADLYLRIDSNVNESMCKNTLFSLVHSIDLSISTTFKTRTITFNDADLKEVILDYANQEYGTTTTSLPVTLPLHIDGIDETVYADFKLVYQNDELPQFINGDGTTKRPENAWEFIIATASNSSPSYLATNLSQILTYEEESKLSPETLVDIKGSTTYTAKLNFYAYIGNNEKQKEDVTSDGSKAVKFTTTKVEPTADFADIFVSDNFIEIYNLKFTDVDKTISAGKAGRTNAYIIITDDYGNTANISYVDTSKEYSKLRIDGLDKDTNYHLQIIVNEYINNKTYSNYPLALSLLSDFDTNTIVNKYDFRTNGMISGDINVESLKRSYRDEDTVADHIGLLTSEDWTYDKESDSWTSNLVSVKQGEKYSIFSDLEIESQTNNRLPALFKELDYIQSSGVQAINTGYYHNEKTEIEFEVQFLKKINAGNEYNVIFGSRSDNSSASDPGNAKGDLYFGFYNTTNSLYYSAFNKVSTDDIPIENYNDFVKIKLDHNSITVDGEVKSFYTEDELQQDEFIGTAKYSDYLFAANYKGSTNYASFVKMKSFKISEDGVLLMNFVPCIATSDIPAYMVNTNKVAPIGTVGLYDTIGGKFYVSLSQNFGYVDDNDQQYELPNSAFKQVDYIESHGNEYIDTGYKHNGSTKVTASFLPVKKADSGTSNWNGLYGSRTANKAADTLDIGFNDNPSNYVYFVNSPSGNYDTLISMGDCLEFSYLVLESTNVSIDGVSGNIGTKVVSSSNLNDYIFAFNVNGTASDLGSYKLHNLKISENGVDIRNFIPCVVTSEITWDVNEKGNLQTIPANTAGLFDVVNDVFYTNKGTNDFEYPIEGERQGELPDYLKEVKYIQSSGTQYIDLGIIANQNTSIEVDFKYNKLDSATGTSRLFGDRYTSNSRAFIFSTNPAMIRNNAILLAGFGSTLTLDTNKIPGSYLLKRNTLKMGNGYLNYGTDYSLTWTPTSSAFTTDKTLLLFTYRTSNSLPDQRALATVYGVKIWKDNQLVGDFIPCVTTEALEPYEVQGEKNIGANVAGLYNAVDGKFYPNQGTGNFTYSEYDIKTETSNNGTYEVTLFRKNNGELIKVNETIGDLIGNGNIFTIPSNLASSDDYYLQIKANSIPSEFDIGNIHLEKFDENKLYAVNEDGEKVDDLKDNLLSTLTEKNAYIENYSYNTNGERVLTDGYAVTTKFISVESDSVYYIKGLNSYDDNIVNYHHSGIDFEDANDDTQASNELVVFYNSSKEFISTAYIGNQGALFKTPTNAAYVRFVMRGQRVGVANADVTEDSDLKLNSEGYHISTNGKKYTRDDTENPLYVSFIPTQTGIYTFYSENVISGDPYIYVLDQDKKPLKEANGEVVPADNIYEENLITDDDSNGKLNFKVSVKLEANKTYYIRPTTSNLSKSSSFEYDIYVTEHQYKYYPEEAEMYLYFAADLTQYTAIFSGKVQQRIVDTLVNDQETGEQQTVKLGTLNGGEIRVRVYKTTDKADYNTDLSKLADDKWVVFKEEEIRYGSGEKSVQNEPEIEFITNSVVVDADYGYKVTLLVRRINRDTGELFDAEIELDSTTFVASSPVYIIKDIPTLKAVSRDMAGYYICVADIYGVDFTISNNVFSGVIDWQGHNVELISSKPLFEKLGSSAIIKNGTITYAQESDYLATKIVHLGESNVQYAALDYIEVTGSQFIDLDDITPNENTRVELRWSGSSSDTQQIIGNGWDDDSLLLKVEDGSYYLSNAGLNFSPSSKNIDTITFGTKSNQASIYRKANSTNDIYDYDIGFEWKIDVYDFVGEQGVINADDSFFTENSPKATYYYGDKDLKANNMNFGDNVVVKATGYVYVPKEYTISTLRLSANHYGSLSINDTVIGNCEWKSNSNCSTAFKDQKLDAGWNKIEIVYVDDEGPGGFELSPTFNGISMVTKRRADDPESDDTNVVYTVKDEENSLKLFANDVTGANGASGRLYYLRVYENETLKYELVPAVRSIDNVVGLLDTSTYKFYTNTGLGKLVKGQSTGEIYAPPIENPGDDSYEGLPNTDFIKLQYIESDGTQYINTGIASSANININVEFERTSHISTEQAIIGADYATTNQTAILLRDDSKTAFVKTTKNRTGYINNLYLDKKVTYSLEGSAFSINDGSEHSINVVRDAITTSGNITIFASNNDRKSPAYGKLYSVKISDGTTLKFNGVPVIATTTIENAYVTNYQKALKQQPAEAGTVGLYNTVDGYFYYCEYNFLYPELPYSDLLATSSSAGTDSIQAWLKETAPLKASNDDSNIPTELIQVDYIESNGYQYIDTGYNHNSLTTIEASFTPIKKASSGTKNWNGLYGSRTGNKQLNTLDFGFNDNRSGYKYFVNNRNGDYDTLTPVDDKEDYVNLTMTSTSINIDGVTPSIGSNAVSSTTLTDYIFAFNVNGTASNFGSYKLHSFVITENGKEMRNFVPCVSLVSIDGSMTNTGNSVPGGTAGLYDKVTGLFYVSSKESLLAPKSGIRFALTPDNEISDTACIAKNSYGLISNMIIYYGPAPGSAYSVKENSAGFVLNNYGTIDTFVLQYTKNVNVSNNVSGIALHNYGTISNGYVCGTEIEDADGKVTTAGMIHRLNVVSSIEAVKLIEQVDHTVEPDNPLDEQEVVKYIYSYSGNETDAGYLSYISSYNEEHSTINGVYVAENLYIQSEVADSGTYGKWTQIANSSSSLPAELAEVDYIQSNGTQYIDLGIKANQNTSIEVDFNFNQIDSRANTAKLFGDRVASNSKVFAFSTGDGTIRNKLIYAGFGNSYHNNSSNIASNYLLTRNTLRLGNGYCYYGDNYYVTWKASTTSFETEDSLLLFTYRTNGELPDLKSLATIYGVKIYDNSQLVMDLVPVKTVALLSAEKTNIDANIEAGVAGLYDKIGGKFYANSGTGLFKYSDGQDNSALNTDYSALITGYNKGTVKNSFSSGDVFDFEYKESDKGLVITDSVVMRRIGPAIGANIDSYDNNNVTYISLKNQTYRNNKADASYTTSQNVKGEVSSLYDYSWYESKLGKDGERFNLSSSIAMNIYPTIIMNDYFSTNDIPSAKLPQANTTIRLTGNEVKSVGLDANGNQVALVSLYLTNPAKIKISNIRVVDSNNNKLDSRILDQGFIEGNYRLDLLLTYYENQEDGKNANAESSYTITTYDTNDGINLEFASTSGENKINVEFYHFINNTADWIKYLSSSDIEIKENYRLTNDISFALSDTWEDWAVLKEFMGKLDGAIYNYSSFEVTNYLGDIIIDEETNQPLSINAQNEIIGLHKISNVGNIDNSGNYSLRRSWNTLDSEDFEYDDLNSTRASLFYLVTGEIDNIIFDNFTTKLFDDAPNSINDVTSAIGGVIVKTDNGAKINNCHVRNSTINTREYGGSLIAYANNTIIRNCSARNVVVKANADKLVTPSYIGGLVGYANTTSIDSSYVSDITVDSQDVTGSVGTGGLCGVTDYSSFYGCYAANGLVASGGDCVGGIVGKVGKNINITQQNDFNYDTSIENCWTTITVQTSSDYAGGIAGYMGLYNGSEDKPLANKILNTYTSSTILSLNYTSTYINRINSFDYENQNYYFNNYAFENQSMNYKANGRTTFETYQFGPTSLLNGATRLLSADEITDVDTWKMEIGFDEEYFDLSQVSDYGLMPKIINRETGELVYDQPDEYLGNENVAKLEIVEAKNNPNNGWLDITIDMYNYDWDQDLYYSYNVGENYTIDKNTREKWNDLADWSKLQAVGGKVSSGISGDSMNFIPTYTTSVDDQGNRALRFNTKIIYNDNLLGHYSDSYLISLPIYTNTPDSLPRLSYTAYALIVLDDDNVAVASIHDSYEWNAFFNKEGIHYNTPENIRLTGDRYDFGHVDTPSNKQAYPTAYNASIDKIYVAEGHTPVFTTGINDEEASSHSILYADNNLSFISEINGKVENIKFSNFYINYSGNENDSPQGIIGSLNGILENCEFENVHINNLNAQSSGIIGSINNDAYVKNIKLNNVSIKAASNKGNVGVLAGNVTGTSSRRAGIYDVTASDISVNNSSITANTNYVGGLLGKVENADIEGINISATGLSTAARSRADNGKQLNTASYEELEYIESYGSQYIDTGIKQDANLKLVIDAQIPNTTVNNYIFGSTSSTTNYYRMGVISSKNGWTIQARSSGTTNQIYTSFAKDSSRHTFTMDASSKTFTLDGDLNKRTSFTNYILDTNASILLFDSGYNDNSISNNESRSSIRLYSFKTYLNDVQTHYLVPCITKTTIDSDYIMNSNSDAPVGTVGLYDLVDEKFYVSNNNSNFIPGPSVDNYYNHIYGNQYVGGVVGFANNSTINDVNINNIAIIANNNYAGGVVGYASDTLITNIKSVNKVFVDSASNYAGGAIGYYSNAVENSNLFNSDYDGETLNNIFDDVNVSAKEYAAAAVASYVDSGNLALENFKANDIRVTTRGNYNGGLIAYFKNSSADFTINNISLDNVNLYNDSNRIDSSIAQSYGSLVGSIYAKNISINDSLFNNINVANDRYSGGLIGYSNNSSIADSAINFNNVSINNINVSSKAINNEVSGYAGGVIGYTSYPTILFDNESRINNVQLQTNSNYVGGVIGAIVPGNYAGKIVLGSSYITNEDGSISNENNSKRLKIDGVTITANGNYVGGVLGDRNGSTKNICIENIEIDNVNIVGSNASTYVGGIAGSVAQVNDCIVGNKDAISNIATRGANYLQPSIKISGVSQYVGGIAGYGGYSNSNKALITNNKVYNLRIESTDIANTINNGGVGGVVGKVDSASVENNIVDHITIEGVEPLGGIVGYYGDTASSYNKLDNNEVNNSAIICYSENTNENMRLATGGIVGTYLATNDIYSNNVINSTILSNRNNTGGIAGYVNNTNIFNCGVEDSFIMSTSGQGVGGIVGYFVNKDKSIYNCYVRNGESSDEELTYEYLTGVGDNSAETLGNGSYKKIKYISSSKDQYIDTGISTSGKDNYQIDVDVMYNSEATDTTVLVGNFLSSNGSLYIYEHSNGRFGLRVNGDSVPTPGTSSISPVVNSLYHLTLTSSNNKHTADKTKLYINGVLNNTSNAMSTCPTSLYLLTTHNDANDGINASRNSDAKIKSFRFIDNGAVIANFVPAINDSNKVGMYDTVSGRFFVGEDNTKEFKAPADKPFKELIEKFRNEEKVGSVDNFSKYNTFVLADASKDELTDLVSYERNNSGGIVGYFEGRSLHDCFVDSGTLVGTYQEKETVATATGGLIGYTKKNPTNSTNEYAEVEYLKSTGLQYIVTDIEISDDLEIDTKFLPNTSDNAAVFGSAWANDNYLLNVQDGTWAFNGDGTTFGNISTESPTSISIKKSTNEDDNNYTVKIGNTEHEVVNIANNSTLTLFASDANGNNAVKGQMYYFKAWNNGILMHDLIPVVRRSDNVPGMFDRITNKFYGSSSASFFSHGDYITDDNLSGKETSVTYTQYEYLTFSGQQYIDLGIYGTNKTEVTLVTQLSSTTSSVSGTGVMFGDRWNLNKSFAFTTTSAANKSSETFSGYSKTAFSSKPGGTWNTNLHTKLKHNLTATKYTVTRMSDGAVFSSTTSNPGDYQTEKTLLLGTYRRDGNVNNYSSYATMNVYSLQIKENNETIRDMVPVIRNTDGVCGMYDKVFHKFYPSNTSTPFTVGGNQGDTISDTSSKAKTVDNKSVYDCVVGANVISYGVSTDRNSANEPKREATGGLIGYYYAQDNSSSSEETKDGYTYIYNGLDFNTVIGPDPLAINNILFTGNVKGYSNANIAFGVVTVEKYTDATSSAVNSGGDQWDVVNAINLSGMYIKHNNSNPLQNQLIKESVQLNIDYNGLNEDYSSRSLGDSYLKTYLSGRKAGVGRLRVADTSNIIVGNTTTKAKDKYNLTNNYTNSLSSRDSYYNEVLLVSEEYTKASEGTISSYSNFYYGKATDGNMQLDYSFWKSIFGGTKPVLTSTPKMTAFKNTAIMNDTEELVNTMSVYASDIDSINLELNKLPGDGLIYTISDKDNTISGIWPNGKKTITISSKFNSDVAVTLKMNEVEASKTFDNSTFANTVMTYGNDYYYLFNNEVINAKGSSINKNVTFIHMYNGELLDDNGNIYDANSKGIVGEARQLSLLDTKPLWTGKVNSDGTIHDIETYATYSLSDGMNINARLYVKNSTLVSLSASKKIIGGPIADTYSGKTYATVLLSNGELLDLGTALKYPEGFKKDDITEINNTIGYNGHIMLVRYADGTLAAFDYLTGSTIDVKYNKPSLTQTLGSFFVESFNNMFASKNLNVETGSVEDAVTYEDNLENNAAYASALANINGNINVNTSTSENVGGVGNAIADNIDVSIDVNEKQIEPIEINENVSENSELSENLEEVINIENSYIAIFDEADGKSKIYEANDVLSKPIEELLSEQEKASLLEELGIKTIIPARETMSQNKINGIVMIILIIFALAMLITIMFLLRKRSFDDSKR